MEKRHRELIIFVVAIAILSLVAVMTLGRGKPKAATKTADQKPPTVEVVQRPNASNADAPGQAAVQDDSPGVVMPPQGDIVGRPRVRDPFLPAINVALGVMTAANRTPVPPPTVVPPVPNINIPPIPNLLVGPVNPFSNGSSGSNTTAASPTPPAPREPIVLTGIIAGDPPVAIFRRADKRYIVKPGDQFADCRVTEISAQAVSYVRGGKPDSVFLGGKL